MILSRYERAAVPPPMHFQPRDGDILRAIYTYDGVLSREQLKAMFWADKSWRAMEKRLSLLYHQGYLDWPSYHHWRTRPIPKPICWLGWRGILWLAGEQGHHLEVPDQPSENQLRQLAKDLRGLGIRWLREPRWSQLAHDLNIVDVRLKIEQGVKNTQTLRLEPWVCEGEFMTRMDTVDYALKLGDGPMRKRTKGVRPDGYFVAVDTEREAQSLPCRARFLLEVDMATHDLNSFGAEKIAAGLAYVQSPAYLARFGANSGRWLVVAMARRRMEHLLQQTRLVLHGDNVHVFLFTTFERLYSANPLTAAIWWQADSGQPVSLFTV